MMLYIYLIYSQYIILIIIVFLFSILIGNYLMINEGSIINFIYLSCTIFGFYYKFLILFLKNLEKVIICVFHQICNE